MKMMLTAVLFPVLCMTLAALCRPAARPWTRQWAAPPPGANLSQIDSVSCCYTLALSHNPTEDGPLDVLETNLVAPGVVFSSIQYPLGSGWQYTETLARRRLRWTHQSGQLPAGAYTLFTFCIDGNDDSPVALALRWRRNNIPVRVDTLNLACLGCVRPLAAEVTCAPAGGYQYTFQFVNHTGFAVHSLRIHEPVGQNLVVEDQLLFDPPLAPGQTSATLALQLTAAAEGLASVCLELTPSRQANNGAYLDCCTAPLCIDLPVCDRCCTAYEDFAADVAEGFTYTIRCEQGTASVTFSATAQPRALNACDRVTWFLDNLDFGEDDIAGTVGNSPVSFQQQPVSRYQLCMTATRVNLDGVNCYGEEASLTVCDTLLIDCRCIQPEQVDLDYRCAPDFELVCGCDSMTYLNACAAEFWSGVTAYTPGECPYPMAPLDQIVLNAEVIDTNVRLSWTITGAVNYRFYLLQRQYPPDPGWTTLRQVSGLATTFLDREPGQGAVNYRVVGVLYRGKIVFSNEDDVLLVGVSTGGVAAVETPWLWPNPANDEAYLHIPAAAWPGWLRAVRADGRLQWQQPLPAGKQTLTLAVAEWPPGLYLLHVQAATGSTWISKLIVIHSPQ